MRTWFESRVSAAYQIFSDGSFVAQMLPDDATSADATKLNDEMTARDAALRADALAAAMNARDFLMGRSAAREVIELMKGRKVPEHTQMFDLLAAWTMAALESIELARVEWGSGNRLHRPSAPRLSDIAKALGMTRVEAAA